MYKLNRLNTDLYEIRSKEGETIVKGPFSKVKSLASIQGFQDLDLAKQIMDENNHNCADFGIYRSFIFSYTDNNLFRLVQ